MGSFSRSTGASQLDDELRNNLKETMQQKYEQPGEESVTQAVNKLQQEVWKLDTQTYSGMNYSGIRITMLIKLQHSGNKKNVVPN